MPFSKKTQGFNFIPIASGVQYWATMDPRGPRGEILIEDGRVASATNYNDPAGPAVAMDALPEEIRAELAARGYRWG